MDKILLYRFKLCLLLGFVGFLLKIMKFLYLISLKTAEYVDRKNIWDIQEAEQMQGGLHSVKTYSYH